jgi:hypothetical protein
MGSSWASPDESEGHEPAGDEPSADDPFADFWSTPTGDGSWLDADPESPRPGRPRRRDDPGR